MAKKLISTPDAPILSVTRDPTSVSMSPRSWAPVVDIDSQELQPWESIEMVKSPPISLREGDRWVVEQIPRPLKTNAEISPLTFWDLQRGIG